MSATTSFIDVVKVYEFSKCNMVCELKSFVMNARLSLVFVISSQLMKACFLTPLALRSIGSLVVNPTMLFASCMDTKMQRVEY